jgi:hypothetical protein
LDEEGVCRAAFDLASAFDEAISLGNKENVTVAQVKQYCEMESHEEKLYKLVMQSKINETKDHMRKRVTEIEKSKVCPILFPKTYTLLLNLEHRGIFFLLVDLYTVKLKFGKH